MTLLPFLLNKNSQRFAIIVGHPIIDLHTVPISKTYHFEDAKADVIQKYSADEARNLKSYGEFPESIKISDTVDFVGGDLDEDIEFDDVDSDESGSGREDLDDIDYI